MSRDDELQAEAGQLPEFLQDPEGVLRRRWPWMVAAFAIGLVATVAYVVVAVTPKYFAEATVLVSSQRVPDEFVRTTVEGSILDRIDGMIGEMLSRDSLIRIIEARNLYPDLRGAATLAEVVDAMRADIVVEPVVGSGPAKTYQTALPLVIGFRYGEATPAAEVVNDLTGELIVAHVRLRSQQARMTTEFMRREVERAEKALAEQERKIREFRETARGELPEELDVSLQKLDRLQQQRESLALQIQEAEGRMLVLSAGDAPAPDPSTPQAKLRDLRTRLTEFSSLYTEEHPSVVSLKRQIEELERELSAQNRSAGVGSRAAMLEATRRTIDALREQLALADREIQEVDRRVAGVPARQEELTGLEKTAEVLRESYQEYLRKLKEAEIAESLETAQQGEQVSVLEAAVPPAQPERSQLLYLAAGFVASIGFALGVAFLLEIFDPVLLTPEQIEAEFGVPVLGSAPRVS
jgi:uncharacterized protein involved in exopolysaccharide biosynthesis